MKKFLLLALISVVPFALSAQAKKPAPATETKGTQQQASAGNAVVQKSTVSAIKDNLGAFSNVIVEGQITHRLSDTEYIFTDASGSMKIDLTGETEFDLNSQVLLGAKVAALGVVKKRLWGDTVLEIVKLKVTTASEIAGL
ncbi:MAG: NirD/YgiW/YdeI family stress tolerance protein [Spirochaetia bacterium]